MIMIITLQVSARCFTCALKVDTAIITAVIQTVAISIWERQGGTMFAAAVGAAIAVIVAMPLPASVVNVVEQVSRSEV